MKKNNTKKPTNADFKDAINHLIKETYAIGQYLKRVDAAFTAYVEYKNDENKFVKFLDKKRIENATKQSAGKSDQGDRTAKIRDIKAKTSTKTARKS